MRPNFGKRPGGIGPAQGQSDNHIFNRAQPQKQSAFVNRTIGIDYLLPLAADQSLRAIPGNLLRQTLIIMNYDTANDMFYRFGAQARTNQGVRIVPGGNATLDIHVPNQDLWLYSALGITPGAYIQEFVYQPEQV